MSRTPFAGHSCGPVIKRGGFPPFLLYGSAAHRDLPSFPTRRSSDLATGIGEAIARRLARAGAAIAVADVNFDGAMEVAQSIGGLSFPVHIDITLSDSVNAAVAEVLSRSTRT